MDSLRRHSRRAVLGAGIAVAGGGLLATSSPSAADSGPDPDGHHGDHHGGDHDGHDGHDGHGHGGGATSGASYMDPHGPEVAAAEDQRAKGPVRHLHLEARQSRIDLGGRTVDTWTYGHRLPGEEIRVTAGDTIALTLVNHLPQETTLHWHGLQLRNDMDGVPDVTQRAIKPGASFLYEFRTSHPGTHWIHPHVGLQQDRGLYAPLIVEDPKEPLAYDKEWVVILDDWLDGVNGSTPETVMKDLTHGRAGMSGHGSGSGDGNSGKGNGSGHSAKDDGSGHGAGGNSGNGHGGSGDGHGSGDGGSGSGHGSGTGGHGTSGGGHASGGHGATGAADAHSSTSGSAGRPGAGGHAGGGIPLVGLPLPGLPNRGDLGVDLGDLTGTGISPEDFETGDLSGTGLRGLFGTRASRGGRRAGIVPGMADDGHGHGGSRILKKSARSKLLKGMPGNIDYPYHLINGRTNTAPQTFQARPGDRIRIRFINAGGDTAYRVALDDHRMTVTHTDGNPVQHRQCDALLIGMAERYDVLVTVESGVFPLVALAEGKGRAAMAVLRTGGGKNPAPTARPKALDGHVMTADKLKAPESARTRRRQPDRTLVFHLTGNSKAFDWAFNGRPYTPSQRYPMRAGERVRMVLRNDTTMWHPVHLHGHQFQLPDGGPWKDTTIMRPKERISVDFDCDNPGLWMLHCHNVYHSDAGMMTVLGYLRD